MRNKGLWLLLGLALLAYAFREPIVRAISRIGESGLNLLKRLEGFSAAVYHDVAGIPTIGYGHRIRPGEAFQTITQSEAEDLLRRDLLVAEGAIQSVLSTNSLRQLTSNQYDALTSFVYNVGAGAFAGSTLAKLVNAGNLDAAAEEFPKWNKITVSGQKVVSAGLTNRRGQERELFLS